MENLNFHDKKLILEALHSYKDDDNEEYNIEINALIKKIQRFKIIDKKSHVITIDNMTSMYHSKPKD